MIAHHIAGIFLCSLTQCHQHDLVDVVRQQGVCLHDCATDSVGLGAASGSSAGAQDRPTSAQGGHSGSSGAGPASSAGLGGGGEHGGSSGIGPASNTGLGGGAGGGSGGGGAWKVRAKGRLLPLSILYIAKRKFYNRLDRAPTVWTWTRCCLVPR